MTSVRRRASGVGPIALAAAVSAGSALSHIGTSGMPFQIGAVIDRSHISAGEAGAFGSLEIASLSLSMILVASWIARLTPLFVAMIGCAGAFGGSLGLFLAASYPLQLLCGVVAGGGFGLVFAATIAGGVGAEEPDRFYAIGNSAALLVVFSVLSAIPVVRTQLGPQGVFACMAGLTLIACPFMLGFRSKARTEAAAPLFPRGRVPGTVGLLFAWMAFAMGTQGLYAFSERIGRLHHLPEASIAHALSVGLFMGLIGTGAAIVLGSRLPRKLALIMGLSGSGLSCLLLGYSTNVVVFYSGVFTYWIFYMFLYSYLLGTAAKLDPGGRLGALGGGLERLGYALGVWAAGLLAEHVSYASTGLMGFAACMAGLVLGLPSVFRALDATPVAMAEVSPPTAAVLLS